MRACILSNYTKRSRLASCLAQCQGWHKRNRTDLRGQSIHHNIQDYLPYSTILMNLSCLLPKEQPLFLKLLIRSQVVYVRIDGFKLAGGELFKEDFRKLFKQE